MANAAWIAAGITALIHILCTRLTVLLVARKSDNAWDNAFGYTVVASTTLVLSYWGFRNFGWGSLVLIAPLGILGHIFAVSWIYQIGHKRAALLAGVQSLLSSLLVTASTLLAGAIAAYIFYGRIIRDPMILIRLILRLIGIELP